MLREVHLLFDGLCFSWYIFRGGRKGKETGLMHKYLIALLIVCLPLAASCTGDGGSASTAERQSIDLSGTAEPESLQDRFAYVFGYQMSMALSSSFEEVNPDYIAMGALDYAAGQSLFSAEEMASISQEYQSEIYRRAEEVFTNLMRENLAEAEAFLSTNAERANVISLDGQVEYEILRQASVDGLSPSDTSTVTVTYQLVTLDGKQSDSGVNVQLDLSDTIPGFQSVVTRMREGEKVRAWVHPDQGYGAYGSGNIGPNQLLIFDIELVSVDDVR